MIQFKSLYVKNFMAVGNTPLGYDFEEGKVYLVSGKNGAGKSSILLDGLNYALYGRAFRSVKTSQIINATNKTDCLVVLKFRIGNHDYIIERGMKPKVYNLYLDGKIQPNQHGKDDEKYLKENILHMDEKTFKQIVILGSSAYTPFMKTTPVHRRTVVEDLLNLGIFSAMARTTKDMLNSLMADINGLSMQEKSLDIIINETTSIIDNLKLSDDDYIQNKKTNIDEIRSKISEAELTCQEVCGKINEINPDNETKNCLIEKNQRLRDSYDESKRIINRLKKEIEFYKQNDICPTCNSALTEEKVQKECDSNAHKLSELETELKKYRKEFKKNKARIDKIEIQNSEAQKLSDSIAIHKQDITKKLELIGYMESDIENHNNKSIGNLSDLESKLADNIKKKSDIKNETSIAIAEGARLSYIYNLVKDGGIKNRIITQYLPLINKLMRDYLDIMGSDIDFSFDDNFRETIKSRFRDDFGYASFSEGQKIRIDLALLFTWREISRLRNSASTNLIIFDEIGDSSLDEDGFACFMKIIESNRPKQCVILISHSPAKIYNVCDRVYDWGLDRGFTRLRHIEENENETSLTE